MKRLWIYILVIQLATGHNALVEVLRVPSLIEHFKEHKAENTALSFTQFLYLHYTNVEHKEADNKHENLPMHCHAHFMLSDISIIENSTFFSFVKDTSLGFISGKKPCFFFSNNLISNYLASILQPPKIG